MADLVERYAALDDDALYEVVGAGLLGAGLGMSPAERDRYRRFARSWFENKRSRLWARVQDSDAYRIWLESAGPGQVADPDEVAGILLAQDEEPESSAALAVLLVRAEAAEVTETYDFAVSCTREQDDYVERVVAAATSASLRVFYHREMTNAWWGRNFLVEKRKVYGQLAPHFVPFISTEYLADPSARDEFAYGVLKAVREEGRYLLPVLVDHGDAHLDDVIERCALAGRASTRRNHQR